jgi:hypothetical protein
MINATSTQNAVVPNLNALRPLGQDDQPCIDELRQVLVKHGALGRFGITLLHSHFTMESDEMLKEYCDEENRTMTLKVVKKPELERAMFTAWNLETGEPLVGCKPEWETWD